MVSRRSALEGIELSRQPAEPAYVRVSAKDAPPVARGLPRTAIFALGGPAPRAPAGFLRRLESGARRRRRQRQVTKPLFADLKIVEAVEQPGPRASSYGRIINVIQWTICGVFLLGAAYAMATTCGSAAIFE